MKVSAVIVTYNSAEVLPGLLDSLTDGLVGVENDVIVVDNASQDASAAIARAHPIVTRVIETGRNGGYAAGINAAIATTLSFDAHLLVLNPDIRLHRGSVRWMLRAFEASLGVGIVVPQIMDEDGNVYSSLRREPNLATVWAEALLGGKVADRLDLGEKLRGTKQDVDWATGAILMISPACRRAIGWWDEAFFLYSEEVDYCRRARTFGWRVVYEPNATCVHLGGDYAVKPFLSAVMTGNRIRYHRRYHGAVSTALFRTGLAVGESIRLLKTLRRPERAVHWAALRAALTTGAHLAPSYPVADIVTRQPKHQRF